LCAASCTGKEPEAYFQEVRGIRKRRTDEEKRLKGLFGGQKKIPAPFSKYERCRKGLFLEQELLKQANQWQAGQIEAVFEIGEFLGILFRPRFNNLWERVGKPPGWEGFSRPSRTVSDGKSPD
jgi:hypothetical protein